MTKTSVRIGAFEIDDAELQGENQGERTLHIPVVPIQIYACNLMPGTRTPAFPRSLTANIRSFIASITINNLIPGLCALPDPMETRP